MIYALDTNIISYLLRPAANPEVVARFRDVMKQGHEYIIPPLCFYEIKWHLLRKNATAQMDVFDALYKKSFTATCMSEDDLVTASHIKADLMDKGIPIGKNDSDIFIASHCIANGYTLVTNNVGDFKRIHGLKIINWKE